MSTTATARGDETDNSANSGSSAQKQQQQTAAAAENGAHPETTTTAQQWRSNEETEEQETGDTDDDGEGDDGDDGDTFPRAYVQELRQESQQYRQQARAAEEALQPLQQQLWEARVTATGLLADPTDLPMPDGADPTDAEAVTEAVTELLQRKPHLRARVAYGDMGQHQQGDTAESFSLMGTMQAHA